MKCPLCNTELRVKQSRNLIEMEGQEPKLFIEFDMICANRNCTNFEQIVEQVKNEQPIG